MGFTFMAQDNFLYSNNIFKLAYHRPRDGGYFHSCHFWIVPHISSGNNWSLLLRWGNHFRHHFSKILVMCGIVRKKKIFFLSFCHQRVKVSLWKLNISQKTSKPERLILGSRRFPLLGQVELRPIIRNRKLKPFYFRMFLLFFFLIRKPSRCHF